jgi:Tfp pilus assembly protein PilF
MDELGKKTAAGDAYQKAISLDPRSVQAHYNLGLLFSELGKVKAANREFVKAIELDPADSDAINEQKLLWKQFPDSLK